MQYNIIHFIGVHFDSRIEIVVWNLKNTGILLFKHETNILGQTYHGCLHLWKSKTIQKSVKQTRLPEEVRICRPIMSFTVGLWSYFAKFFAALTSVVKVSPERTISLTKAECLRGWGIILQCATWIALVGGGC